jgi:Ser/Thr protein kinase RdoA (MazF antagonist)
MKFFVGQTFNIAPPSLKDKLSGVKCLARLNLLKSTQDAAFDPWLLIYLADEYDKNHHLLSAEDDELVRPIVEDFRKVDLTQFSIGMVHYDLHRDNIQKDSVGNVCLFDMETIGNGYPIVDLATYIGLTCLEPEQSVEENQNIYQQVLSSYTAIKTLSPVEHSALETLTKAIFASNVVAANYLIKAESDNTKETYKWYDLGKKLLQKLGSVSLDQGSLA